MTEIRDPLREILSGVSGKGEHYDFVVVLPEDTHILSVACIACGAEICALDEGVLLGALEAEADEHRSECPSEPDGGFGVILTLLGVALALILVVTAIGLATTKPLLLLLIVGVVWAVCARIKYKVNRFVRGR